MRDLFERVQDNTKKMLSIISTSGLLVVLSVFLPSKVFAQGGSAEIQKELNDKITLGGEGSSGNLIETITNLLNFAVTLTGIIAVGFLIYGGVMYITAGGDEAKVEKATKAITQALIGLGIVLLSGLIINFVITQITDNMAK